MREALTRTPTTNSLIVASGQLLQESIDIIININLDELDNKQLQKLVRNIFKNIDSTDELMNELVHVANPQIKEAVAMLQASIDKSFIALSKYYNVLQERILSLDCDNNDLINYASFVHELSLKLLKRAAAEPVEPEQPLPEDLQKYL